jgi:hypothetical protein
MSTKKVPEDAVEHEEFLTLFRRGLKFSEELLAENEKLRFKVASLEGEIDTARSLGAQGAGAPPLVAELRKKVEELEREKQRLLSRYQEVETQNRDYQERYAEIEEEHNNLANLYIASFQLHATTTFRDVVQVLHEIVINLVGAARFTLYFLDVPTQKLHPIAGEGHDFATQAPIALGAGPVGAAAEKRLRALAAAPGDPVAIVPLATAEHIVGALVINELLVQKPQLTAVDHELFNLLSVHAATALLSGLLRDAVGTRESEALSIEHARKLL